MAMGAAKNAIPELKKALAQSRDEIFTVKTQWYLALAYLQTGNADKAKTILGQIAASKINSEYTSKAAVLAASIK